MPATQGPAATPNVCTMCNTVATIQCPTCSSSWYCSAACQLADAAVHNTLCGAANTPAPSSSHRRAILFPVDSPHPHFVWIHIDKISGEGFSEEIPEVRAYLGPDTGPLYLPVTKNALRGRALKDTLHVICREAFGFDGSPMNRAAYDATQGRMWIVWRGAVLAFKKQGLPGPRMQDYALPYSDIGVEDLRDVVDFFHTNFGGPGAPFVPFEAPFP
ncbi:hypothetical protein EDC01DRAFT_682363 [Geopyxis carbonaria]|nr:hypothetical protein EDC01DRAFT_682363 [Geopyxis carbonaria]